MAYSSNQSSIVHPTAAVSNISANNVMAIAANNLLISQESALKQHPSVWHLPMSNRQYFAGRQKLLADIENIFNPAFQKQDLNDSLRPVTLAAFHGLGGIGKTQLAIYYLWNSKKNYDFRIWFLAESPERLLQDYREFCALDDFFNPPLDPQASDQTVINKVQTFLSQVQRAFIIYDNAPDYESIVPYLPSTTGDILITSRYKAKWRGKIIEVSVLSPEEAITLVKKRIGCDDTQDKEITALVKELGYLPLALSQAAAYIKENIDVDVAKYLEFYKNEKLTYELLSEKSLPSDEYPESVALTWKITMKAIQNKQPIALTVLKCCAYLPSDNIPMTLCDALISKFYKVVEIKQEEKIVNQQLFINQIRTCLVNYSMLQYDLESDSLNMHRVLQTILKFEMEAGVKENSTNNLLQALLSTLATQFKYMREKGTIDRLTKLLPHSITLIQNIQKIESKINAFSFSQDAYRDLTYAMGVYFLDHLKNPEQAKLYLLIAKNRCKSEKDETRANIFQQLGNAFSRLKEYDEAISHLKETINIRGDSAPENFKPLCSLANIFIRKGGEDVQINHCFEYLEKAKNLVFGDPSKEAMLNHYYGNYYYNRGERSRNAAKRNESQLSESLRERAKDSFQKAKGYYISSLKLKTDPTELARTNNQLGSICWELEDFVSSATYHIECLKIRVEYYGKEHNDTKDSISFLTESLEKIIASPVYPIPGNVSELFEKCLSFFDEAYGKDSSEYQTINSFLRKYQNPPKSGRQASIENYLKRNESKKSQGINASFAPSAPIARSSNIQTSGDVNTTAIAISNTPIHVHDNTFHFYSSCETEVKTPTTGFSNLEANCPNFQERQALQQLISSINTLADVEKVVCFAITGVPGSGKS